MTHRASRRTEGRYNDIRGARKPGDLPHEGRRGNAEIRHATVEDPNPAFLGQRQRVAVNVKTDALENEYAYGRISDGAYIAARVYQRILETSAGSVSGGGQWGQGDRTDACVAAAIRIVSNIANAEAAVAAMDETMRVVGKLGAMVLKLALVDRLCLTEVAERLGNSRQKLSVNFYTRLFRASCEALADHWSLAPRAQGI